MQESSSTSITITNVDGNSESLTQTPKPESTTAFSFGDQACSMQNESSSRRNAGLPIENNAIPSIQHIEHAELPMNPCSNDPLKVDENTISQTQFEIFDRLEKYAETVVTRQAEELFSRVFNAKIVSEHTRIEELKKEIIQMAQLYNKKIVSEEAEIAKLREYVERHSKAHEETISSGRAKMMEIQKGIELLQMRSTISHVEVLDKEWELTMLQRRKRDLVRVGRDGNDEFIKVPFSEQCYIDLAREILRRCRPEDRSFHGCYRSASNEKPEMMSDFNLNFLSLLSKGPDPEDGEAVSSYFFGRYKANRLQFDAAAWFIGQSLLVDREETFRCLAAHPYFQQMKQIQHEIKQELIWFFDRRFTYQMGQFYGINFRLDDTLLRLGSDSAFRPENSLDCGGPDEIIFGADNKEAWTYLLTQNLGIREPSMEKCSTNMQTLPIPDRQPHDSVSSDEASVKRSERVTKSEVEQYNIVAEQDLAPETSVKRANRVTESEIVEYKILTTQALGQDPLELKTNVLEDSESIDSKAMPDNTEDNAGGVSSRLIQSKDGTWQRTSMIEGDIIDTTEIQDVSLH
jgi:hypothetical protein